MRNLRGYLPTLALLAAVGAGILLYFTQPSLADRSPQFEVGNSVARIDRRGDELRFRLTDAIRTYRIASGDDAVYEALRSSVRTGNPVALHVTPYGAQFLRGSDTSLFWVESLEYDGKTFGPFAASRRWSWRSIPAADAALLRAAALSAVKKEDAALVQLDGAIAAAGAGGPRTALAFRQRALVLTRQAYPPGRPLNEHDDRLLVRALADLRRAASLEPGQRSALERQETVLYKLGAYQEALALYDEIERRWPQRRLHLAIGRAEIFWQLGRHQDALEVLDELAEAQQDTARKGGMKLNYHRAVSLNRLGRHEEAVRAITAGLETQPDFMWAFVERSCARARLGQIEAAHTDLLEGYGLWAKFHARTPFPSGVEHMRTTFAAAIATLDAALAKAPHAPATVPCANDYDVEPISQPRARSAFLPEELPIS